VRDVVGLIGKGRAAKFESALPASENGNEINISTFEERGNATVEIIKVRSVL